MIQVTHLEVKDTFYFKIQFLQLIGPNKLLICSLLIVVNVGFRYWDKICTTY